MSTVGATAPVLWQQRARTVVTACTCWLGADHSVALVLSRVSKIWPQCVFLLLDQPKSLLLDQPQSLLSACNLHANTPSFSEVHAPPSCCCTGTSTSQTGTTAPTHAPQPPAEATVDAPQPDASTPQHPAAAPSSSQPPLSSPPALSADITTAAASDPHAPDSHAPGTASTADKPGTSAAGAAGAASPAAAAGGAAAGVGPAAAAAAAAVVAPAAAVADDDDFGDDADVAGVEGEVDEDWGDDWE